jgi:brefeldin A-resistance guanine nucleotide exchange factor 1
MSVDIREITPLVILSPFLALVRSPLTSGPITSLALAALHSIIVNILPVYLAPIQLDVKPSTPLQIALAHLTSALSQCRFPSSSPQQDELVLLRLLRVIDSILLPLPMRSSSNYGSMLDQMADESVCELLEVGLGMLARARLGEGLRTAAQSCVQGIVRACFARLKTLTKDDVDRLLASVKKSGNSTEPTVNLESSKAVPEQQEDKGEVQEDKEKVQDEAGVRSSAEGEKKASLDTQVSLTDEEQTPPSFTPHGLPTILELLRVLIALLNPSDQAHTDTMRLCALAILNTALEVGGVTLGKWPELREGLRDEGCRYLFQVSLVSPPNSVFLPFADTSSSPDPTRPPCCLHRCARHRHYLLRSFHTSNYNWNFSYHT